jgi:hypothetical protein
MGKSAHFMDHEVFFNFFSLKLTDFFLRRFLKAENTVEIQILHKESLLATHHLRSDADPDPVDPDGSGVDGNGMPVSFGA